VFGVPRRKGVVAETVAVPDFVVSVMNNEFRPIVLRNLASDFNGFALSGVERGRPTVAFSNYSNPRPAGA